MSEQTVKPKARPRKKISEMIEIPKPEEQELDTVVENEAPVNVKKTITKGIIAVDNGGDNTKVFSHTMDNPTYFKSKKRYGNKSHYLLETYEKYEDDEAMRSYIVEYNGVIYLTNLRTEQSNFDISGNTKSKASEYFIISTLIAIAKFGFDINYLVTSIPLKYVHTKEEDRIKELLIGEHEIKIDNKEYKFEIREVEIQAEAQSAILYLLPEGKTTILELGSRTAGYATNIVRFDKEGYLESIVHIPQQSDTLEQEGVLISNLTQEDFIPYCSNIFSKMSSKSKITEDDNIVVIGGGVLIEGIRTGLQKYFNNITFDSDPLYAQVRGMLIVGEDKFSHLIEDDENE